MIQINYLKKGLGETDVLIVPVFANGKFSLTIPEEIEDKLNMGIDRGTFSGTFGEVMTDLVELEDESTVKVIFVGLGNKANLKSENYKTAGAKTYNALQSVAGKKVGYMFDDKFLNRANQLKFLEGLLLRNYFEGKYKTGEDRTKLENKIFTEIHIGGNVDADLKKSLARLTAIIAGTHIARDLVVAPSADLKPADLAVFVENMAVELPNLEVTSLNKSQIEKEGMGLLLAVNRGSSHEPRLIVMTLNGSKKEKPLVFVGKGITFDSGGYNLKPSSGMGDMHTDMAGAAAVVGTMYALAASGSKRKVIGIIPSTENLVNGDAYKPSDIIMSHAGKTVQIMDTDAEGRLVLADAMSYAKQFEPVAMVDLATLTGACIVALGERYAGLFSNTPELLKAITRASETSGDKVWPLPLDEEFKNRMKSKIADLGNLAQGLDRYAGASTGAAFLSYFAGDTPWAHLDIAGPSNQNKELEAWNPTSGASGFGVHLLCDLVELN